MLLEFTTELQIEALNKYFEEETDVWEVLPGIPYAEKRVESLGELCTLMKKLEDLTKLPLSFEIQLAPKNDPNDEEMAIIKIYDAKKRLCI